MKIDDLRPGTQIAYIPNHACGDINHKDVEFGFVTNVRRKDDTVFCRYWLKESLKRGIAELRTKSNSEITPVENIVIFHSVPQEFLIDALVDLIVNL